ncbi:MAG: lipopolysaccharide biosynthesis protein [Dysgonomonas sp.]
MINNKGYNFFRNSLIFAVSTFASRAITLLLLPMYSYSLTLSEYGKVDLSLTMIMLIIPFITLNIHEAVLKYTIESNSLEYNKNLITTVIRFLLYILIPLLIVSSTINFFYFKIDLIYPISMSVIFLAFYESLSKFTKAIGEQGLYAKSNIIIALVALFGNFLLVYYYNFGAIGVLVSHSVSYFLGSLSLILLLKFKKIELLGVFKKSILKNLITLSLPLVPNAIMWWIFNASDRFIIYHMHGEHEVGIYGVANRISSIILIISTILFQAWQISAIRMKNDRDKKYKYTNLINDYILFIFLLSSWFISLDKFFITKMLSDSFSEAWLVGNVLIFSSVFYSLASWLGVFYVIEEKTKRAFISSSLSALVNLVLNVLLIPSYGIYGAAVATLLSTIFIFIFRLFDTSRNFKIHKPRLLCCFIGITISLYLSVIDNLYLSIVACCIMSLVFFIFVFDKFRTIVVGRL